MSSTETICKTFAEDIKMNPQIIRIMAEINKNSCTSYRKQKQASRKFFQVLTGSAKEQKPKEVKE